MRRSSSRLTWLAFAAAVAVVLAAMGWTTASVLRLDRRARIEENARLALWRMDSALGPLIAAEQARPAAAYADWPTLTHIVVTPLPGTDGPFVRLYFQYAGDGTAVAPRGAVAPDAAALRRLAPFALLDQALPPAAAPPESVAQMLAPDQRGGRGDQEYRARVLNNTQQLQVQEVAGRAGGDDAAANATVMRPVWTGEQFVLARRVSSGGRVVIQGCCIDWANVERWLLDSVKDLLPDAKLVPVKGAGNVADERLLASLPVQLIPGDAVAAQAGPGSPLRASLIVAWACVLLATAAVALLLRGVVSLSERRGAFVSAVTHELRTPLTTLRMYAEMLSEGMVTDEGRRRYYLATLRAEADRLGHLVENVLAYSRLERNRAGCEVTTVTLADVLPRAVERLAERARQAGMELAADVPDDVAAVPVRANALALEQVLFNLVDNACKYAAGAADKRIHLSAAADGGGVRVSVRDHGPGIPARRSGRLYHPFSKSVQEAANTAPGLGLGLALSRRLAQSMGGELKLDRTMEGGATFVLFLPRAE